MNIADNIIELPYNFDPRNYQHDVLDAFLNKDIKRFLCIWHRRAGKDKVVINLNAIASQMRVGSYFYMFPTLKQAKSVIWKGIDEEGRRFIDHFPSELIKKKNESELSIEFLNGSIFQLLGADNFDGKMGTNPVGVTFSEFAIQSPMVLDFFRPIVAKNNGFLFLQTTPRGKNHAYDLYNTTRNNPKWFVSKLTVDDTKNLDGSPVYPKGAIQEEIDSGMKDNMVQQEFYCSFDASSEAIVYGREIDLAYEEGRIYDFEINQELRVYTFWDIGRRDKTAIWFMQFDKNKFHLVYYYQANFKPIDHFKDILDDVAAELGIKYAIHFGPHDLKKHVQFAGDKTQLELAKQVGINFRVVPLGKIMDGIQSLRSIFCNIIFHETNCKDGLASIRNYGYKYNEVSKTFHDMPEHNWASDGADALRYMAVGWNDFYNNPNAGDIIQYDY